MRFTHVFFAAALAALPLMVSACGDDSSSDSPGGGGSGATGGGSGGQAGGSTGGTGGGTGGQAGNGGTGGGTPTCDLTTDKTEATLEGDVNSDMTLTSDKTWLLKGTVRVNDGATLKIEPCTKIKGDKASLGTIVVERGGKIDAVGTKDEPILFTSALPAGARGPGDWGGIILLGKAPNNEADFPSIEGLTTNEAYGGTDPADSSGKMSYVRIEYSGVEIGDGNEINGLTFGSVGSGTQIDHIMVSNTLDDCFEFFGGTVTAKYLVCNNGGDDMFDGDQGFQGKLQFIFGRQRTPISDDPNGFEMDNDKTNPAVTPVSNPTIYNATLCGVNKDIPNQQYGAVFRRGFTGTFGNVILTGFEGGVDFRDVPPTSVDMMNSVFFGNSPANIAYAEDGSNADTQKDDDGAFDEIAWFNTSGKNNSESDPGIGDCFGDIPSPLPASELSGATPPRRRLLRHQRYLRRCLQGQQRRLDDRRLDRLGRQLSSVRAGYSPGSFGTRLASNASQAKHPPKSRGDSRVAPRRLFVGQNAAFPGLTPRALSAKFRPLSLAQSPAEKPRWGSPREELAVTKRLIAILLALFTVAGCGYSEDEWQAQLEKYNKLNQKYDAEAAAHAQTRQELAEAKARIKDLTDELKKMGVNMDTLNQQLQQTGTEKEQLAASLEQLKTALEEYKQRAAQLERIKARFELLRNKLQKLTNLGLKVEIRRNRMVIRLPGDVLFASGKDDLKKEGKEVLSAVAEVIRNDKQLSQRYYQIAGHTDNKPLKGGRFGDNWGLSVMRARQVLLFLVDPTDAKGGGGGLDPIRLHAAGYGDTDPVASNDTPEGRQQNRRVELVIMPDVEEMLDLKGLI